MKKIFNRKIFNFKKSKGTTIVEVLVSVIIIGIVSMYGLSFFSSSYRFATDSKDYHFVLQEMVRKMEMVKGSKYQKVMDSHYSYDYDTVSDYIELRYETANTNPDKVYPSGISSGTTGYYSDKLHFDFKWPKLIRTGCEVEYFYESYENVYKKGTSKEEKFFGSTKIVLRAEWPKGSLVKNKITLVTYVADDWSEFDD